MYKNTKDLIECQIKDCAPSDTFLIGTWGNQGKYKTTGSVSLFGEIEVKSIDGATKSTLRENAKVWRDKRLWEKLTDEPTAIRIEPSEPTPKSNKLIDILGSADFTDDIIAYNNRQKQETTWIQRF